MSLGMQIKEKVGFWSCNETFISILDGGGAGESKGKLYSAALQAILKGLVMWIIGELDFLFVKSYFKMPWSF